jgi:hypothetical protein
MKLIGNGWILYQKRRDNMFNKKDFDKALDKWLAKISPSKERSQPSLEQQALIEKNLGYCGAMISSHKQAAKTKGKEHLAVFNANIVVEGFGKVWFGDIDVTIDEEKIKKLALGFKSTVYVLREMDARFDHENSPQLQNAVYSTDGVTNNIGQSITKYYERINDKIYARKEF